MKKIPGFNPATDIRYAILATDITVFTIRDGVLLVRLIPIHKPPHFPNSKGLPGGLILPSETAEDAVKRIVTDKSHIDSKKIYIEQLFTFSDIDRDPRGRVVSVAYMGFVPWNTLSPEEQADSESSWWSTVKTKTSYAYDHDVILRTAIARLRSRISYTTIIQKLLPPEFTLTELEKVYEHILGTTLDKRNFRKKILKLHIVTPLKNKQRIGKFRPAQLYTFTSRIVQEVEMI